MTDYLAKLQAGLEPAERLNQIVEHGMCIGCGICQSMVASLKVEVVTNGYERPIISGPLDHQQIDRVLSVCPGTRVEGMPEHLIDEHTKLDPVWGVWHDMFLSYSAEPDVRHMASTGGLLTGIALYLLESKQIDFVLHAKASSSNPSFGEACISRNREQVLNAAGSRYGPTATLKNVIQVIEQAEANEERFAFIGTPCDVSALRNYAKLDPRVDQYCDAMLTMVCGGFMAPSNMRAFLAQRGIKLDSVSSLRYRGYGCPGPTTINTTDGKEHEFTYLDFWGDDEANWGLPPRCKVCPDGIGDSADIAAADTWDGGSPTVKGSQTDLGTNAAVVRTARGLEIINSAIHAGYLIRSDSLTPADMNRFQPHQEKKKRAAWARFEGMRSAGNIVPNSSGLRLRELHQLNSQVDNEREYEGARKRVCTGKFKEESPRVNNNET